MSVVDERDALEHPVSLFDHARWLHRLTPDGPLPNGGSPFPDGGDHPNDVAAEPKLALADVLGGFIADPTLSAQDLHEQCTHLTVRSWGLAKTLHELVPDPSPRLRDTARWLVRNGTDRRAVLVGLGLLDGNAEQSDVALIKTVGLLRCVERLAVEVLAKVPTAARDLIWLAERSRRHSRIGAVRALVGNPDPVVRAWVLSTPRDLLSSDLARRIAEGYPLLELLGGHPVDDSLWDQVGTLLVAMTCPRNYQSEIGRYKPVVDTYRRWVALAGSRTVTLDRAALLTMVAQDLCSGPAAPVVGALRTDLIAQITDVLVSEPWTQMLQASAGSNDAVQARRAAWVLDQATQNVVPAAGFAVRVVVPDPNPIGFPQIEARILMDGMPIVASAFDKGPAEGPEDLVDSGRLRATSEPKEVRLAEAYCTEGCCGGLYVTIVREGSQVVWKDWRSSKPGDPPGEVRFDAAEYDWEVARAEQDHRWEWPARTLARLVADRLRADPTILAQWDCKPGWCTAWLQDFDAARLTFLYPANRKSPEDHWVQFGLVVEVTDQDPKVLATQLVESMRTTDPKATAEMIGGSKEAAETLGLTYRPPSHW